MNNEVLYFGCLRAVGHFLHRTLNREVRFECQPWRNNLDGGLLDSLPRQTEGVVVTAKKDGWTVIAFWDRSVDSRGNSNSAFLIQGDVTAEELLELARNQWPEVFSRPRFPKLSIA